MRAFEVHLNGKRLCLAGIGNDGVLTAIANWVVGDGRKDMWLRVGGLILPADEHISWPNWKLRVGDEIKIVVRETTSADKPPTRRRRDPRQELKDQKKYVRRMARELGWKIQIATKRRPKSKIAKNV
jgi:hypothetical protein